MKSLRVIPVLSDLQSESCGTADLQSAAKLTQKRLFAEKISQKIMPAPFRVKVL